MKGLIKSHHEETRELPGEIDNARNTARGRPRTAWVDNIKTWTGLPVDESIRVAEKRDKWRKYVHGVANPQIDDGYITEHSLREPLPQFYERI